MSEGVLNMLEWPGRCDTCKKQIEDWADAGEAGGRWVHKACYAVTAEKGKDVRPLNSPIERSRSLEWPMLTFILLFHFGIGVGFIGWIMLTQDTSTSTDTYGAILLAIGLITPLIGVAGIALNVVGRRRIELVRRALDLSGGWKPNL